MKRSLIVAAAGLAVVGAGFLALGPRDGKPPAPPPLARQAEAPAPSIQVTPAAASGEADPGPAVPAIRSEDKAPPFAFKRYDIDLTKPQAEVCLAFSARLDASGKTAYGDYVRLTPDPKPAIRAEGDRLCLGGLPFGARYQVALAEGLPAADGGMLAQPMTVPVTFSDKPASAAFAGSGHILPRGTTSGLAIETVNLDKVALKVLRIGERLIGREWQDLFRGGDIWGYQLREIHRSKGALVWSGDLTIANRRNEQISTVFPLAGVIPERKPGAYLVILDTKGGVADDDDGVYGYSSKPYRLVVDTDLALTSFKGADGLRVFVRRLSSADPVAGARLNLVAVNNDILGEATTGEDGGAAFPPGLLKGAGGLAAAQVMAFGPDGDFSLTSLSRAAFDLSDRGVGGRPSPSPADAFLYTDRGIYRPGETVRLGVLLRDAATVAMEGPPTTLVVNRPNGTEFSRRTLESQGSGAALADLELPRDASRGLWTLTAFLDPKAPAVGQVQVDVQDFVPQRLKVIASSPTVLGRPGRPLAVEVDGAFLYGAPAADLQAELRAKLVRDPAPFPAYKAYRFGRADDAFAGEEFPIPARPTDAQGKTRGEASIPEVKTTAPLKAEVTAGLVEPGGRLTATHFSVPVRPSDLLIGIRPQFKDGRVEEGEEARFDVIALDAEGKPVARSDLHYSVIEEESDHIWTQINGRWTWERTARRRVVASGTFDLGTERPALLAHKAGWRRYELSVHDPAAQAQTSLRFRGGWAATVEAADIPDKLEVTVEKTAYKPGETARLNIRPPFAGKALIMVASDRVFETRTVDLPRDGVEVSIPVRADWGSGAYVMATLVRPLAGLKPRDPVRAMGLAWVGIDPSDRTLTVDLGAPEKMAPRRSLDLAIKIGGIPSGETAFMTVAAVDEGILQLTRFRTPDPADHYFGKRRLGVEMRDDYASLLRAGIDAPGQTRSGGDGIGGKGLPVVPTRSTALFSGLVKVDGNGQATVSLAVPDFNGRLRVMAIAHSRTAVGRAEGFVTVRDPLAADVSLPRFLAPGDEGRLTLLAHNLDGPAGTYRVDLSASGAVALGEDGARRYELDVNGRKVETIAIKGLRGGIGAVAVTVAGPDGWSVERSWPIAVRSPHYPITLEKVALQDKGEEFKVDPALLAPFEPGTVAVTVNYGGLQGLNVPSLLQSLSRYPHGCTEQTVSVAFPLLFFNDPALIGAKAAPGSDAIRERVQQAVFTVLDRQDEDGAIGLWRPGDGAAGPFVEAYAIDFLLRARSLGFTVPDRGAKAALGRLATLAERHTLELGDRAYVHYLQAREGVGDIAASRYLHDTRLSTMTGALPLAQLGAALALRGDRTRAGHAFVEAAQRLGKDAAGWPSHSTRPYYYYGTWLRDFAGTLALAAETKQDDVTTRLLERLGSLPTDGSLMNTQEKAWLLRAASALAAGETGNLAISSPGSGPTRLPSSLTPNPAQIDSGFAVTNAGDKAVWRSLVIHGAPLEAPQPLAQGFSLEKRLLNLKGEEIDPLAIRQNDRFIVRLSGRSTDGFGHQAVLVDPLPAGWEIEAVVRRDEEGHSPYPFLGKLSPLRTREARDDRFVAAFDLGSGSTDRTFQAAYLVRAVTPGRFTLPAAVIEDMYRPQLMARTPAGRTEVKVP
ncbi:MAG: alpha-2-macroglobulin family protein [Magnetospirillum sp. WYHS-4]